MKRGLIRLPIVPIQEQPSYIRIKIHTYIYYARTHQDTNPSILDLTHFLSPKHSSLSRTCTHMYIYHIPIKSGHMGRLPIVPHCKQPSPRSEDAVLSATVAYINVAIPYTYSDIHNVALPYTCFHTSYVPIHTMFPYTHPIVL